MSFRKFVERERERERESRWLCILALNSTVASGEVVHITLIEERERGSNYQVVMYQHSQDLLRLSIHSE